MSDENYTCEYCGKVYLAVKFSYQRDAVYVEALCYGCAQTFVDNNPGEYCGGLVEQLAMYEAECAAYDFDNGAQEIWNKRYYTDSSDPDDEAPF